MITQEQLDVFQQRLETLKEVSRDNIAFKPELADIYYPKLVQELLNKLQQEIKEND